MGKRLKVLFLPPPPYRDRQYKEDVLKTVGLKHDISVFDYHGPLAAQSEGVDIVIDEGGSHGTREMMDVSRSVKLWQILGTGFDHFDLAYCMEKKIPVANCPGQFSVGTCSAGRLWSNLRVRETQVSRAFENTRKWIGSDRSLSRYPWLAIDR